MHDQLRSGGRPSPLRLVLEGVDGEGQFGVIMPIFAQFQAVGAQVTQLVLHLGKAPPRARRSGLLLALLPLRGGEGVLDVLLVVVVLVAR